MKKPVFTGSAAALVTPFTDRGVDYDRLAAALDRQAEGGTAAVVVCGTTGEAATLSEAERASIIEFTAVYTRSRMKVIAGIGGNDTLAAANAARRAERLGADALLLTTPYYNKASSEGIVRHFAYVAEHSELPLIVYNVPGRTLESFTGEDGILQPKSGWTDIFIYPGYRFKAIDALVTNFHLPESTLIMLVSALAGRENVLRAYEEAVKERYRFFSFGDAMFIH